MNEETWQVLTWLGPPCEGKTCSFYFSVLHHDADKQGTSTITWLSQTIFLTKRGGNYRGTTLSCGRKFCCGSILCIADFLYFEGTYFCDWKNRLVFFSLWYLLYEQRFFGGMNFGVCGVARVAVSRPATRMKAARKRFSITKNKLVIICNFRDVGFN